MIGALSVIDNTIARIEAGKPLYGTEELREARKEIEAGLLDWHPAATPPPFKPHDTRHDWEFTSVPVLVCLGEGRDLCMARYRQHMDLDTSTPDPDSPPRWTTHDGPQWDIETVVAWTYVTAPEISA